MAEQLLAWVRPARGAATRTGRGDVGGGGCAQIDDTEFHARADGSLSRLYDALDAADLECLDDLGFDDGVLTVKLVTGGTFVINKHFATKQIWYASPISGALYFSAGNGTGWVSEARGQDLETVFLEDLVKVCPEAASLDLGGTGRRA